MTDKFEDRLITQLRQEAQAVAADWEPRREPRRVLTPTRTVTGLVTAAAALGAFVALPGGGAASTAYAVEAHGNGGVEVRLSEWPSDEAQVRDFMKKLNDAGIATVYNPSADWLCQPLPDGAVVPASEGSASGVPAGADTAMHRSHLGGAKAVGPEFGRAFDAVDSEESKVRIEPGARGTVEEGRSLSESDTDSGAQSWTKGEDEPAAPAAPAEPGDELDEDYVWHLRKGDTGILTDTGNQESLAFARGACTPSDG